MSVRSQLTSLATKVLPATVLPRIKALYLLVSPSILKPPMESWDAACRMAKGYQADEILKRVSDATEKVVESNGKLFERDSVLFEAPITPFPLLAFLLHCASKNDNRLVVIDFGGSLGSTYRQCAPFLGHLSLFKWSVVEQRHFVDVGRQKFSTDTLSFFETIESAAAVAQPSVIIFSGVLQYLEDPYSIIARAKATRPMAILIDRNSVSAKDQDTFSVQVVPDEIFPASFPFRVFGQNSLESALQPEFRVVAQAGSVDPDAYAGQIRVQFLFKAFERVSR